MNANGLKKALKEYFTFSRSERNGLIILCTILLMAILFNVVVDFIRPSGKTDFSRITKVIEDWQTKEENAIRSNKQTLFPFNPNEIDSLQLDSLELPYFIKNNLLKYRNRGGKFYKKADFKKLYGMTDSLYSVIEPFLILKQNPIFKYRKQNTETNKTEDRNQIQKGKEEFKEAEIIIELNSADSVTLIKLKGIGSVFASRIIKYRNILGGFYSKKQLLEVYNFDTLRFNQIENQLLANTNKVHKMPINFIEFKDLLRHPYFTYDDVKAIFDEKDKNGAFKSFTDFKNRLTLGSEKIEKMLPYLKFN